MPVIKEIYKQLRSKHVKGLCEGRVDGAESFEVQVTLKMNFVICVHTWSHILCYCNCIASDCEGSGEAAFPVNK